MFLKHKYEFAFLQDYTRFDGKKTIVPHNSDLEFLAGSRLGLTFYDIQAATVGYQCTGTCLYIFEVVKV